MFKALKRAGPTGVLKHHHGGLKALQSEQGVVNQLPNHHGAPRGEEQTPTALRVQPGAQHEAAWVQVPAAGAEAAAGARQRPGEAVAQEERRVAAR